MAKRSMSKRSISLLVLLIAITACGPQAAPPPAAEPQGAANTLTLAPVSALSPEIRQLPPDVQEAYRFALANPDTLSKIPCYCGCNRIGHMSNLDCYVVSGTAGSGEPVFDSHAFG